jgi:hypothetical protein
MALTTVRAAQPTREVSTLIAPSVGDDRDVARQGPYAARSAPVASSGSQRLRRGVAVVVVGADRHHRDAGAERGEEIQILISTAVVRHLQHVDLEAGQKPRQARLSRRARCRRSTGCVRPSSPRARRRWRCWRRCLPTRAAHAGPRGHTCSVPGQVGPSRSGGPYARWTDPDVAALDHPVDPRASPSTWSAWIVGEQDPGHRPDPERAPGSGRRLPGPVRRRPGHLDPCPAFKTSASPCPTSQAINTQSSGGQPGDGGRANAPRTDSRPNDATPARRRRSTARSEAGHQQAQQDVSAPTDQAPLSQPTAAPATDAARSATSTIQATHRSRPASRAAARRQLETSPTSPSGEPSTVAGPTSGATSQVGGDRHQAHLTGDRGHDGGAGQLRGQRHRDRLGQPARQPPGSARRDTPGAEHEDARRSPAPRARSPPSRAMPGSSSSSTTHRDAERPECRACARCCAESDPAPRSPSPRPGATLGSVRASSTKPDDARCRRPAYTASGPAPRHHRAPTIRKPTRRVRLVPETAVR